MTSLKSSCSILTSSMSYLVAKIWRKIKTRGSGGDTSITREAPKEATKNYNLRRNVRIRCHPYEVNNMLILTKKFKNLSLEDISISKDFEDMKRSKPMKMRVPLLNP